MTKYLPFVFDENDHYYHNDKSFHIIGKDLKWLISFLNSSLFKFTFSDDFPELQGGTRELRKVFTSYSQVDEVIIDLLFQTIEDISWKPDYLPYSNRGLPTSNIEAIRLLVVSKL